MYVSAPLKQTILQESRILKRKGRKVSKPYKTTYNGQTVWQIWYSGKPIAPLNKPFKR